MKYKFPSKKDESTFYNHGYYIWNFLFVLKRLKILDREIINNQNYWSVKGYQ